MSTADESFPMSTRRTMPEENHPYDWPLAHPAEDLLRNHVGSFLNQNSFGRDLAKRMREETGTDLFEWLDHLVLPAENESELLSSGFRREEDVEVPPGHVCLTHPRATLPRVLLSLDTNTANVLCLRPEHVADFHARHNLSVAPSGEPYSRYRVLPVYREQGTLLEVVERLAYSGFVPGEVSGSEVKSRVKARELWHARPRLLSTDAEGFETARRILEQSLELVGPDVTCHFCFEAERAYWESRNRAARLQKQRQDQLGLGWGNHDHHTFRCSRVHFVDLIEILITLGFQRRERYYAGAEAGWGAQILEHPMNGIVVFADVDLQPEETALDFSTWRLPPAQRLGTVGLWVGLHGESFLEAGMHHLEARFDFELLREQLGALGIPSMKPFSNFEFLRQAFTEGERWSVRKERAESLHLAGLLTREQCNRFIREGALGSHLENLQRHGGFKGFNQRSVSAIIAATDPRNFQTPQPAFSGSSQA